MKIYVSAAAAPSGDGTEKRPYQTIGEAAKRAVAGDEVIVLPGCYRERVDPVNGGEEGRPITYRSAVPGGAVITGAEPIKGWTPYQGNVWTVCVSNTLFGDYNPYTTFVYGDWYFAGKSKHTGCVYLNDQAMYEAASLEECIRGEVYPCSWEPEASVYKWYSRQEGAPVALRIDGDVTAAMNHLGETRPAPNSGEKVTATGSILYLVGPESVTFSGE